VALWKIQRELSRVARQIGAAPSMAFEFLVATPYYDRVLASRQRHTDGALPPSSKVAVYLIYPDRGVLASHRMALEHLHASGYAPLVVSNLALTDMQRADVSRACWRLIERPNYGYDFGGYRDAVLSLAQTLPKLERLVLLNDSAWFPLPGARNWLADAQALGTNLAAAASNYGARRVDADDFRDIVWQYSATHRSFHYTSYALSLSSAVLRDPDFLRFWKRFRMSRVKRATVRRGEIGLTQWALRRGHTHAQTCPIDTLDRALEQLDDAQLERVLDRLVTLEDERLEQHKLELQQAWRRGSRDRKAVERLILTTVARVGSSYAIPGWTIGERGFGFLKKSPLSMSDECARATLEVAREMGEVVWTEAQALRQLAVDRRGGLASTQAASRPTA
jgi:hypothetical protein